MTIPDTNPNEDSPDAPKKMEEKGAAAPGKPKNGAENMAVGRRELEKIHGESSLFGFMLRYVCGTLTPPKTPAGSKGQAGAQSGTQGKQGNATEGEAAKGKGNEGTQENKGGQPQAALAAGEGKKKEQEETGGPQKKAA